MLQIYGLRKDHFSTKIVIPSDYLHSAKKKK